MSTATTAGHRYRALGYEFEVCADDPEVATTLAELLTDLRVSDGPARHRYEVRSGGTDEHGWELRLDGRQLREPGPAWTAVAALLWSVNQRAVTDSHDTVLLHAGAVSVGGAGVLVAGASESGKSTLVGALVRAGAGYLTDEVVALDPDRDRLVGYPRALSLDRGSWRLLPELAPHVVRASRALLPDQWQLPVSRFPGGQVHPDAVPRVVVLPRYRPDAEEALRVLRPVEAVVELNACVFPHRSPRATVLRQLAWLASRVRCVELLRGDLGAAVATIRSLSELPPRRPEGRRRLSAADTDAASIGPGDGPRYRRRPSATLVRVGGDGLIDDPRDPDLQVVNAVGADLWELLERPRRSDELTAVIARVYDRPVASTAAEVAEFLTALRAADLVVPDG